MNKLSKLQKSLGNWIKRFWILLSLILCRIERIFMRWLCIWRRLFCKLGIIIICRLASRGCCFRLSSISLFCRVLNIIRLLLIVTRILRGRGVCRIWIWFRRLRDRFSSLWWRGSSWWIIYKKCRMVMRGRSFKEVMGKEVKYYSWLGKRLQSKQKLKIELIS